MRWIAPFCLIAPAAFAKTCPPVPDHAARLDEIIAGLQAAETAADAGLLNQQIWAVWTTAPDEQAQALLDEGMRRRDVFDFLGAGDAFDRLVAYCPDYAEGYNQRAFASYLRQDYDAALIDLNRTLEIVPNHIGALSGKALTLIGLGRHDDAQQVLRAAVALNPWLQERHLIVAPKGTDI
ncbi:tetratricopeptide repeat protein [Loktanella agnita]|uniref:tetratricopeptide repeat protein n=1 Tax=Loktanella agnita TaxID=287097 RepID=UPI0039866E35